MKSKIDEVIYWIKDNHGYSNEFGCIMVESEMLQELLEQLRPYVELGELTYLYETTTDTRQRPDLLQKLYNLIDKIKEQEK